MALASLVLNVAGRGGAGRSVAGRGKVDVSRARRAANTEWHGMWKNISFHCTYCSR